MLPTTRELLPLPKDLAVQQLSAMWTLKLQLRLKQGSKQKSFANRPSATSR